MFEENPTTMTIHSPTKTTPRKFMISNFFFFFDLINKRTMSIEFAIDRVSL